MKYLLICDHVRLIQEAISAEGAMAQLPCKSCRYFDLKQSKWVQKNIRAYPATDDDMRLLGATVHRWERKKEEPV